MSERLPVHGNHSITIRRQANDLWHVRHPVLYRLCPVCRPLPTHARASRVFEEYLTP